MSVVTQIKGYQPGWFERPSVAAARLVAGLPERPEHAQRVLEAVARILAADQELVVRRAVPWLLEQLPSDRAEALWIVAAMRATLRDRATSSPSGVSRA